MQHGLFVIPANAGIHMAISLK